MSTLLAGSVAAGACGLLLLAAPCYAQTATQQQTTMAQTESPPQSVPSASTLRKRHSSMPSSRSATARSS